ncbi:hypothetical protein [Rhodococcus jostii]|uniref:hypothetical protein n=1 Tax=Rhodococcus jostii TaxID=132919 RepID=UPI00363EF194
MSYSPCGGGAYLRSDDYAALDAVGQHRVLAQATATASGTGTAVSHASALALHGIELWNVPLALVHMTANRTHGGKKSRRRHLHATPFDPDEVTAVDGVLVTTVARSLVDFARTVPFEQAVVSGDHALRLGCTDPAELAAAVARAHHRTGARRARRAVAFTDGLSESAGESRSRVLLLRSTLPIPELQQFVYGVDGRPVGRVDFLAGTRCRGRIRRDGQVRDEPGPHRARGAPQGEVPRGRTATGTAVARWTWKHLDDPETVVARIRRAFEIAPRSAPFPCASRPPGPV